MKESNKVIIDPVTILPTETFTRLFPFLPIFDIAHSSSVSRTWRQTILSDSTLFREVDLTRLDQSENVNVIINHLDRFSSLSLDKLDKVSLNLNSFFGEYQTNDDFEVENGSIPLLQTLSRSRDSLQTLFLTITTLTRPQGYNNQVGFTSTYFLNTILGFPNLTKVCIEVDSPIDFQVGEDLPSSKMLSVKDLSNAEAAGESVDDIFRLIKAATRFVGTGLTRLSFGYPETSIWEVVEVVETHKSTLRSLFLDFSDPASFEEKANLMWAAASCPELTDLTIYASSLSNDDEEAEEETVLVGVEDYLRCPRLEKLTLDTDLDLDWGGWSKWSGHSLKELLLLSSSFTDPMPFVLNSRLTLQTMSLNAQEAENEDEPNSQPIHFPKLWSIELKVSPSLFRVFSNLVANNLRYLEISGSKESAAESFEFLCNILERHASNLTDLRLNNVGYESSALAMTGLNFHRLRRISGYSCHEGLFEWLSHFQYPNLIGYYVSVGKANDEQIKKQFQLNAPNLELA